MVFLDAFDPADRATFEGAATRRALQPGAYLIRRGQPGGDVYLLLEGSLDVLDDRQHPEVLLNTLGPGAILGEVAFVDGAPRSADVRARSSCTVLHWPRGELRDLLACHPALSARFFEGVARLTVARVRGLTDRAVGAYATTLDESEVTAWIRRIVDRVKGALPPLEAALRTRPTDGETQASVGRVLDELQASVTKLFAAHDDVRTRVRAAALLRQELHPYLVRSRLADLALRRVDGVAGYREVLMHAMRGESSGDGRLGEVIDRWLLERPTFRAIRERPDVLMTTLAEVLPTDRAARVLVVDLGTGELVRRVSQAHAAHDLVVTVIDQDSLALEQAWEDAEGSVEVRPLPHNPARLALRQAELEPDLEPHDVVVVQGLLEHLPERMAIALVAACQRQLVPGGWALITSLAPSDDRVLLDRLLEWPTIRRHGTALQGLIQAAGLSPQPTPAPSAPAQLVLGRRS
ncbi:MAG: cyclic nucleotide-binding domain-containing protein [Myxococcales bacterium]|nr:cyclic nucleotide-binding domain-containing protein [Myxococcales bacterium]